MRMPRKRTLPGIQPLTSTATRFLSSKPTVSTSEGETSATPSIFRKRIAHPDIEAARELVGAAGADDHQVDPLGLIDRHERLLEVPGDPDQDDDGRDGDRQPDGGQDRADRAMNDVLGDQGDEPHEWSLYGPRSCSTGCAADENVADAVPDFLELEIAQDSAGDRLHVESAVAFHHVGEGIAQVHQVRDDPAVEAGNSQFVAEHAIRQVGQFVGDDDGRAGRATRTISRRAPSGSLK